jgi:hypothetical protein
MQGRFRMKRRLGRAIYWRLLPGWLFVWNGRDCQVARKVKPLKEQSKIVRVTPEQNAAGSALTAMADVTSANVRQFSGWMLGGFGAAIALIVANLGEVAKYFCPESMFNAVVWFIAATFLTLFGRYLSLIVQSSTDSWAAIRLAIERGLDGTDNHLNIEQTLRLIAAGTTLSTQRWLFKLGLEKISEGDYTFSARVAAKASQWQSFLMILQVIAHLVSVAILIAGMGECVSGNPVSGAP